MRIATYVAGAALVIGLGATAAFALLDRQFPVRGQVIVIMKATGPRGPLAKPDKVVQKVVLDMTDVVAMPVRGSQNPDSLGLSGLVRLKKSKPSLDSLPNYGLGTAFPIAKLNSKETKGSMKAGNEELAGFRSGIDSLLSLAANANSDPTKTRKDFIGGSIQSSNSKQKGNVKVDTKTFTKLSGAVSLKGDAFVSGGPNDGYAVKYKIKVKFKPDTSSR